MTFSIDILVQVGFTIVVTIVGFSLRQAILARDLLMASKFDKVHAIIEQQNQKFESLQCLVVEMVKNSTTVTTKDIDFVKENLTTHKHWVQGEFSRINKILEKLS